MHFRHVLEIGAGAGEHFQFIRHSFDKYILTDLDPKVLDVARKKLAEIHDGKIGYEIQTANGLTYSDNTFDRLVAIHVLEHIYYPHLVLKEWHRVLKHGGILSILIPTDPGLAWRLGRHFGPRRNAIKQGLAYDYIYNGARARQLLPQSCRFITPLFSWLKRGVVATTYPLN